MSGEVKNKGGRPRTRIYSLGEKLSHHKYPSHLRQIEFLWRLRLRKEYLRSGRLRMVERRMAGRKDTGPARVLTLCACGRTKVCQLRDLRLRRVAFCSANCRQRLVIRHPHRSTQRIHSFKTGKLIRLGPPRWDPELRAGVFADGYSPVQRN
jgi:hypothetical protein